MDASASASAARFAKEFRMQYLLEMVTIALGIKDTVLDIRLNFMRDPKNEKKLFHFVEGFAQNVHFDDVGYLVFYKSTRKGFNHYKIKKRRDLTSDEITETSLMSLIPTDQDPPVNSSELPEEKEKSEEDEWQVRQSPFDAWPQNICMYKIVHVNLSQF